ncbi:hypothetical protein CEUSTIGMA_g12527.t1 [Chlamydomonas eustigma]|uniref:Uncharacterized protein n=1 Tax=Chlamydomonas eustigma TaxID=1157962 RepID=A0A250XPV6_9CHLO|nr:hypothetical protein CEUSTIGMA_g12527.t1 [Chlamydomonas eustigma]|eukprot:GAX85107.1 hypothetical protein CEUSTIGMA_g12527.t1 [Chlamydomonas eustigma]
MARITRIIERGDLQFSDIVLEHAESAAVGQDGNVSGAMAYNFIPNSVMGDWRYEVDPLWGQMVEMSLPEFYLVLSGWRGCRIVITVVHSSSLDNKEDEEDVHGNEEVGGMVQNWVNWLIRPTVSGAVDWARQAVDNSGILDLKQLRERVVFLAGLDLPRFRFNFDPSNAGPLYFLIYLTLGIVVPGKST